MITREELEDACSHGLLQSEQVEPLFSYLNGSDAAIENVIDPEEMHFAKGFHDIFISIGLGILFAGYFIGVFFLSDKHSMIMLAGLAGSVVLNWLLAEWFSKRLRLSLPSILLAGGFIVTVTSISDFIIHAIQRSDDAFLIGQIFSAEELAKLDWVNLLAPLIGFGAGWLFYKRFNVPITPAFMALGIACFLLLAVGIASPSLLLDHFSIWLFGVGLICLAAAMWFDIKDPLRQTIQSDKGFWLHLISAPMLVHSILAGFSGMAENGHAALTIIGLIVVLGFIALVIDRRAMLASALGYLGFAIGTLLNQINLDSTGIVALTMLFLGIFVLMLGSGWNYLRRLTLRPLAEMDFARYLPPLPAPANHTN